MRFIAYARNLETVQLMMLEQAKLQQTARSKFQQMLETEMTDSYDAAVVLMHVGAFCVGNCMQGPSILAESFLQTSPDKFIDEVFLVLKHKLHTKRFATWVDVNDVLFSSWFARICRAYQKYDTFWQCASDPVMDLTPKDVNIINRIKETHCLTGHELPLIWEDPMHFLVPSNDNPLVVRKTDKNVIIITDGAICFKIKPLSDGKHFAATAEYSNGKPVNLDQVALHKAGLPILPTDADPRLWEAVFTTSVVPGDTLSFKYNDKRVKFTL